MCYCYCRRTTAHSTNEEVGQQIRDEMQKVIWLGTNINLQKNLNIIIFQFYFGLSLPNMLQIKLDDPLKPLILGTRDDKVVTCSPFELFSWHTRRTTGNHKSWLPCINVGKIISLFLSLWWRVPILLEVGAIYATHRQRTFGMRTIVRKWKKLARTLHNVNYPCNIIRI